MRKYALKGLSVCFALVLTFCGACRAESGGTEKTNVSSGTVVLDAGHGGIDGGVKGRLTGVKESDLNLEIVKELSACFRAGGFKVVLTRRGAGGLYGLPTKGFKRRDMEKRMAIANGSNADLFLSVHVNFFPSPSRRDAQVFFKEGDERSRAFAERLQKSLNEAPEQPGTFAALAGDYFVLNECECVSALAECGFLSNEEDERLLTDKTYREKLAFYLYKGAVDYLTSGAL